MRTDPGAMTRPTGYRATGVACGLKKEGRPDLAFLVSDLPAEWAGVFTRNQVKGHSLVRTRNLLECRMPARAVVINSGNANACVGPEGDLAASRMAELAAAAAGCQPDEVLTGSTGVIGKRLDLDRVAHGIAVAGATLGRTPEDAHAAMQAIMTTDRVPKEVSLSFDLCGVGVTLAGMAKGSGMIHPDMATMIAVIVTDAAVSSLVLELALRKACDRSFNRVSVDGDTSVCDMVLLLANGAAGNARLQDPASPDARRFSEALDSLCDRLARAVAKDGEGATKLVEVRVRGAMTPEDARLAASAVARSPLVKTAMFGEDANWGRILTAVGYSGAAFDPGRVSIGLGDLPVCRNGCALDFDEARASEILAGDEILLWIDLGQGESEDHYYTCDFSYEYVRINGSYRT